MTQLRLGYKAFAEHVARIGEYIALGFTHLVFHAPGPDQARSLDAYAEHILPRIRRTWA